MEQFVHQLVAGLATGAIYASLALALVMIYHTTHHLNFAQGQMAMFSTYLTWAMLQAGMIYGFSQGKVDYAKLPAGVNPDNIKFIAAHKAELDAMQQEFAAMGKRKN